MDVLIPCIVIVISNVCSDYPGGRRWEFISASFGYVAAISLTAVIILPWPSSLEWLQQIFMQIATFSLVTALSRDYEKIFKPLAEKFFNKKK